MHVLYFMRITILHAISSIFVFIFFSSLWTEVVFADLRINFTYIFVYTYICMSICICIPEKFLCTYCCMYPCQMPACYLYPMRKPTHCSDAHNIIFNSAIAANTDFYVSTLLAIGKHVISLCIFVWRILEMSKSKINWK